MSSQFFLLQATGEIIIVRSLDFENKTRFELVATAEDNGIPSLTSSVSVLILILPVNDNPPIFARDNFTFIRNESSIFSELISATDADNDTLQYTLTQSVFPFLLDTRTGLLHTSQALDYEEAVSYSLSIQVTDGVFNSQTQIIVNLIDQNDNSPIFSENYSLIIDETFLLGTVLLQVTALDRDSGVNGNVTYFINDPTANQYLLLNSVTGSITLKQMFDFEILSSLSFLIYAVDGGVPQLTGQTTLVILLTDADDNPPSITSVDTMFQFIEESGPLFLGSEIEVVDNDTHPLIEAVIRLTTPPCVFTVQELQIGCDNDQLCVSRCGEMLEVCVLFIFR